MCFGFTASAQAISSGFLSGHFLQTIPLINCPSIQCNSNFWFAREVGKCASLEHQTPPGLGVLSPVKPSYLCASWTELVKLIMIEERLNKKVLNNRNQNIQAWDFWYKFMNYCFMWSAFFWGQKHWELWDGNFTMVLSPWFQSATLSVTNSQAATPRTAPFSTESAVASTDEVHLTEALLCTARRARRACSLLTICAPAHPSCHTKSVSAHTLALQGGNGSCLAFQSQCPVLRKHN